MELRDIGAEVDWPETEVGVAAREALSDEPSLGLLGPLVEWVYSVRPPDARFTRVRGLVVGAEPAPLVIDTATELGAEMHRVADDGDVGTGAQAADDQIERGGELLVVAVPEMRADAAIAVAVLTGSEPAKVLARGAAATDPETWMQFAVDVRDGRRRCMPLRDEVDGLLAELDSSRLTVTAGLILRASARRTPVLLDGPVAAAAALLAYEAQPRAVRWWAAADSGADPVQELTFARLGLQPVIGIGSGRGDGLAGALALPVLRVALRLGERASG